MIARRMTLRLRLVLGPASRWSPSGSPCSAFATYSLYAPVAVPAAGRPAPGVGRRSSTRPTATSRAGLAIRPDPRPDGRRRRGRRRDGRPAIRPPSPRTYAELRDAGGDGGRHASRRELDAAQPCPRPRDARRPSHAVLQHRLGERIGPVARATSTGSTHRRWHRRRGGPAGRGARLAAPARPHRGRSAGAVLLAILARRRRGSSCAAGCGRWSRWPTTAGSITAGDLSQRVDAGRRAHRGRPARLALNTMLDEIERAFAERDATEQRLRQFLADASHELRTPLTSIQGFAELFRLGRRRDRVDLPIDPAPHRGGVGPDEGPRRRPAAAGPARRDPARSSGCRSTSPCSPPTPAATPSPPHPDRPITLDAPDAGRRARRPATTSARRSPTSSPTPSATRRPARRSRCGARPDGGGATVVVRDHGAGLDARGPASTSSTGSGRPTRPGSGRAPASGCPSSPASPQEHGGTAPRPTPSVAGPLVLHPAVPVAPGEVVEGHAADGGGGEVARHPRGDLARRAGAAAHHRRRTAAADEVVDLAVSHVLLELGQRRGRVGAVEAADGHHRVTGGELVASGLVGADGGGHPGVGVGVGLEGAVTSSADGVLASSRPPSHGRPAAGRDGASWPGTGLRRAADRRRPWGVAPPPGPPNRPPGRPPKPPALAAGKPPGRRPPGHRRRPEPATGGAGRRDRAGVGRGGGRGSTRPARRGRRRGAAPTTATGRRRPSADRAERRRRWRHEAEHDHHGRSQGSSRGPRAARRPTRWWRRW